MSVTQIDGGRQIRSATITTTQLSGTAGITDGQLATSYSKADGTRAFTGEVAGVTPTSSTSLATKGYVDTYVQGLDAKYSARAITATETLTIAAGSVTQIAGTTVNGVTIAVGDYILIPNAPASTGAAGGSTFSAQPANGLYKCSNNTTNLTVARAPEQSGSIQPAGDYVFIKAGTYAGGGFVVTTPSADSGFTYGTNNIVWTQFSGAGEITVTDGTLVKTGNDLKRAPLTGDVTAADGANATVIAAAAVTLAKMANLAANSVIANNTGSGATPTALGLTAAATASTAVVRDANANVRFNNQIDNFQTVASAGTTTTLTVSSPKVTQITGSTTQTVVLPDATTLVIGQAFTVTNRSSGAVTVNMNGGSLLQTLAAGAFLTATVVTIGTAAGTWDNATTSPAGGGTVTAVSVASANGFAGSSSGGATPALTISTSITGVLKGNGTAISAAAAGTDYMAPSGFVFNETPSGTKNGINPTFTLANTPNPTNSVQLYQNGIRMVPGAGNDFTVSTNTITMLTTSIPGSNDTLLADYQK